MAVVGFIIGIVALVLGGIVMLFYAMFMSGVKLNGTIPSPIAKLLVLTIGIGLLLLGGWLTGIIH